MQVREKTLVELTLKIKDNVLTERFTDKPKEEQIFKKENISTVFQLKADT